MANTASSDAVLTAFFDTDSVCDKIELASNIKGSTLTKLGALQTKHAASGELNSREKMFLARAFEEYLLKA